MQLSFNWVNAINAEVPCIATNRKGELCSRLVSVVGLGWNVSYLHLIFVLCLVLPLHFLVLATFLGPVQGHMPKPSSEAYTCLSGFLHTIIREKKAEKQPNTRLSLFGRSSLDKGFISLCSGLSLCKRSIKEPTYEIF